MNDETTAPQTLSDPITVRLPRQLLDAIDNAASERGKRRSQVLVEAVHMWMRLHHMGIDPQQLYFIKNKTRDEQLRTAQQTINEALTHIDLARQQLVEAHKTPDNEGHVELVSTPNMDTFGPMEMGPVEVFWVTDEPG